MQGRHPRRGGSTAATQARPLHLHNKPARTSRPARPLPPPHVLTKATKQRTPLRSDFMDKLQLPNMASNRASSAHSRLATALRSSKAKLLSTPRGPRPAATVFRGLSANTASTADLTRATSSTPPKRTEGGGQANAQPTLVPSASPAWQDMANVGQKVPLDGRRTWPHVGTWISTCHS